MAERRITCPGCGQSEEFEAVRDIIISVAVDGFGAQIGGARLAGYHGLRLRCPRCYHGWRSKRSVDFRVDGLCDG